MFRDRDRRQQVAIGAAAVAEVTAIAMLGTVMPVYIGREASPFAVTLAFVAFSLGLTVFAPVWGAIADVTGRRRTILVSTTLLAAVSLTPLTVFGSVTAQIVVRGVFAVFFAAFGPVMLAVVSERGGDEGRGRSVGFYNSATSVGGIGGRLFGGLFLGWFAPQTVYGLIALIALVATAVAVFVADPTPDLDRDPTAAEVATEVRRRLFPAVDERDHLRTNGLGWLYGALVLRNMTIKGVGSVVPIYLVAVVGLSDPVMGALLALSPTLRVGIMYLFGRTADRVGRKPLIVAGIAGGGLQALVLVAALGVAGPLRVGVAAVAFVVHAVSFSALATGTIAFIGDVAPADRESELMGLRTTVRGFGGVLGALLLGAAATKFGYVRAFVGMSLLAFAGAAITARTLVESRPVEARRRGATADD